MSNPANPQSNHRPILRKQVCGLVLSRLILSVLLFAVIPAFARAQATPEMESGASITAAGSATLGPVLEVAGEAFAAEESGVPVEVDLATRGRTIRDEEASACEEAGIEYEEFEVAFDGVAIVVNPENTAVTCVTVDQLKAMWEPDSTVASWADVDSSWPDEPLSLYGIGEESGTYQFFTQVTVGEEGVSRDDYNVTEGHPETADSVAGDPQGLGFLPFPRYLENQDRLTLLEVDGGEGCVLPSPETIQDGSYAPLSRPLYVYVSHDSLMRQEVQAFLEYWFADAAGFAEQGGLVPSNESVYESNLEALTAALDEMGTPQASPAP